MAKLLDDLDSLAMFNGAVIIDQGGAIRFQREVGMASYELGVAIAPDSRFRLASLSKYYTEAVVVSLAEKGLLSLDQTIDEWLPEFPGASQISIESILEHKSGIPHTNAQEWGSGSGEVIPLEEMVRRLSTVPLDFEPGSDQRYSNGGFAVLVLVLERVSGLPWAQLLSREVLEPLGLAQTGVITDSRVVQPGLVTGYEPGPEFGSRARSRAYSVEMRPGGGDMYASAPDVRRFFSAIWREKFGGKTGDQLFRSTDGVRTMTGRSPGFYTAVLHEPSDDVLVVSLANNYAADFNWAESLAAVAVGRNEFIQSVPRIAEKPWIVDTRMLGPWRYESGRFSQQLTIGQNSDGSLFIDDGATASKSALLPLAEGGYLETMYFGICKWSGTDDERITCSRWYPEGFVADFIRR